MREWWSKICRALQRRRGLHEDLEEEMRSHLDFLIEDKLTTALPRDQVEVAARREFGNRTRVREQAQEAWQFPSLETVLQDLRYSLRAILRSPGFSLVVLVTLALGIGVNTAIFSVVYAVLLRPLPYPAGERLVRLGESSGEAKGISVTWINFEHWRSENHTFEDMAGFENADLTLTGRGEALLTHAGVVTSDFFRLTGSRPLLGQLFTAADDRPGSAPVVLLSYQFWAGVLGGDAGVLGHTLDLNGKAYQVIGVLRPGLNFFLRKTDLYLPLGPSAAQTMNRGEHKNMRALALLKPGVTLTGARTDLNEIMRHLARVDPGPENDHRVYAEYLSAATTASIRQTLLILMAAVGLVLIIVCVNVSSLLLVRSAGRVQEFAVRTAIGAGRGRLMRQLITENLLLAVLGGGLGLLLAELSLQVLVALGPANIPRLAEVSLDIPVLLFACAITLIVGLLAGVSPVHNAGKIDVIAALKEGSAGSGTGKRWQLLRNGLVIGEIAITIVLAFASGLLLRSLVAAQTSYPGFNREHLLALELQLPPEYKSDASIRNFYGQLIEGLRHDGGVQAVGAVTCPPSAGDCGDWWYSIVGKPTPNRNEVPLSLFNTADSTYFRTMQMRMLSGREFTDADQEPGLRVAVINEELARKWWSDPRLALGEQIKAGGPYMSGVVYNIVGVVGNVSQMGLDSAPMPEVYLPFSQHASSAMVVMIRTAGDPGAFSATARRRVASLDRNVPIQSLRPFEKWLGAPLERRTFSAVLLSMFAALAMVLAGVGIYGTLNYWVRLRQKEIAVRMALGARRATILSWAGLYAARLAVLGLVLGALSSWVVSRWLATLVFGVSARDPRMMLAAAASAIVITGLAACVPLLRVARVDMMRSLRNA